jgi:hypothetical protein
MPSAIVSVVGAGQPVRAAGIRRIPPASASGRQSRPVRDPARIRTAADGRQRADPGDRQQMSRAPAAGVAAGALDRGLAWRIPCWAEEPGFEVGDAPVLEPQVGPCGFQPLLQGPMEDEAVPGRSPGSSVNDCGCPSDLSAGGHGAGTARVQGRISRDV